MHAFSRAQLPLTTRPNNLERSREVERVRSRVRSSVYMCVCERERVRVSERLVDRTRHTDFLCWPPKRAGRTKPAHGATQECQRAQALRSKREEHMVETKASRQCVGASLMRGSVRTAIAHSRCNSCVAASFFCASFRTHPSAA
eukprot:3484862-Rhodomonas_salina.2